MRRALAVGLSLGLLTWGCAPQCESVSPTLASVCRVNDGMIETGVAFTLEASPPLLGATCQVIIDGGQVQLVLSGLVCGGAGVGSAKPVLPQRVKCEVPGLDAGTYVVTADPPVTFTVPQPAGQADDAGVPPCR